MNIGDWAVERPYRDYSAYFISKGAIPTLTRMFAVELAPQVRVNAVLPGPVLLPESVSEAERRRAIAGTLARPRRPAGKRRPRRRRPAGKRLHHRRLPARRRRPHDRRNRLDPPAEPGPDFACSRKMLGR